MKDAFKLLETEIDDKLKVILSFFGCFEGFFIITTADSIQ